MISLKEEYHLLGNISEIQRNKNFKYMILCVRLNKCFENMVAIAP